MVIFSPAKHGESLIEQPSVTVNRGIALWEVDGNPMEEFMRAICWFPLPALENYMLWLSDGSVDGAHPPHRGIKVGAIGTGVEPLRYEYHAEWDAMFLI